MEELGETDVLGLTEADGDRDVDALGLMDVEVLGDRLEDGLVEALALGLTDADAEIDADIEGDVSAPGSTTRRIKRAPRRNLYCTTVSGIEPSALSPSSANVSRWTFPTPRRVSVTDPAILSTFHP